MIKKLSYTILLLIPMLLAAIMAGCQNKVTPSAVNTPTVTRTSTVTVNTATITRTSTAVVVNTATETATELDTATATATVTSTTGTGIVVDLGAAASFGAFGYAGVTNSDDGTTLTEIIGDLGTTGALSTITGFPAAQVNGTIWGSDSVSTIVTTVFNNATTAYNYLAGLAVTATDPGAELGTLTLPPGTYATASGSFSIISGDLTLDSTDPNAVWVFKMANTLTVGNSVAPRSIILLHEAKAKNVYWQVGTAATINPISGVADGGTMVGTIIANAAIAFSTAGNTLPAVLNGRAISLGASVTMVTTDITVQQ